MTFTAHRTAFQFHIERNGQDTHTVPAGVLIQILENAQRAFDLIGLHLAGRGIKERARVPSHISQSLQLVCTVPEPGSYVLPVEIGGEADLFQPDLADKAFSIFKQIVQGVARQNAEALHQAMPDPNIQRRVLESIKGMAPSAGAPWRLELQDEQRQPFACLDEKTIPFVETVLVPKEQREAARVVTGELKSIDFAERKVTIIYPPTSKELACIYEEAVEDFLYEKRRDLIQVTGRVLLDEQGLPKQIIDVTDIRDLDLSPLVIDKVRYGKINLKANRPLTMEPFLDETKQLMCIEDEALAIDVYATTRESLLAELHEQIAMLWQEYAKAPDEELDVAALKLKHVLRNAFTEVDHAP